MPVPGGTRPPIIAEISNTKPLIINLYVDLTCDGKSQKVGKNIIITKSAPIQFKHKLRPKRGVLGSKTENREFIYNKRVNS